MREIKFQKKLNSKVVYIADAFDESALADCDVILTCQGLNTVGKCFLPFDQKVEWILD